MDLIRPIYSYHRRLSRDIEIGLPTNQMMVACLCVQECVRIPQRLQILSNALRDRCSFGQEVTNKRVGEVCKCFHTLTHALSLWLSWVARSDIALDHTHDILASALPDHKAIVLQTTPQGRKRTNHRSMAG